MKKIWIGLIVLLIVGISFVLYWNYTNIKTSNYQTYAECVSKTGLPCKFNFVGDFGHEWIPSPWRSEQECLTAFQQVGRACLIPTGNFKEVRWIGSGDIAEAQREQNNSQPVATTTVFDGWKIYTNSKYNFEFQYPPNTELSAAYNAKESGPVTGKDDSVYVGAYLQIETTNPLGNCSDLKTTEAIKSCLGNPIWTKTDAFIPMVIGERNGVRREITLSPPPQQGSTIAPVGYIYYVNNRKMGLQISAGDEAEQQVMAEKIISTFKFISPISDQSLPNTCIDKDEGIPVITSLSSYMGKVGETIEIRGCNFSGFEGDKNAWIESAQGIKGIIYSESGSTSKLLKIILKSPLCQKDNSYTGFSCDAFLNLTPGTYKIFISPWSKESNKVNFIII